MFDKAEWQRNYRKTARGKAVVRRYATSDKGIANYQRYYATDTCRERANRNLNKHPVARAARHAVSNAIRDGLLIKNPCEVCGEPNSQAHHDDYYRPLDVRWLCKRHHENLHHPQLSEN